MVLHSPLESRSPCVMGCSQRAAYRGVRIGMPLAEARMLVPRARFEVDDPPADREHLRRLAWTCQRFTPRAGLEEAARPENLFLDVTGCVPHFGNIRRLCEQLVESFQSRGYSARIAAAPTFGAAWAVVHAATRSKVVTIVESEGLQKALSPLCAWGLRLPERVLSLLAECGVRTIGQLLELPRASLPSRFGMQLPLRIDQAFGDADEMLVVELPPRRIRAAFQFEFPLREAAGFHFALRKLLDDLVGMLKQRSRETQHLLITWSTEEEEKGRLDVRLLRPTSSAERLWKLLLLHLERVQIATGVATLEAEAFLCRSEGAACRTLFDEDDNRDVKFLDLIERLGSRLGEDAIVCYRLVPEAQPELASIAEPWLESTLTKVNRKPQTESGLPRSSSRPLRLFASPIPVWAICEAATGKLWQFRWGHRDHVVALCEGPERIETGWWREEMIRRDYYRVEAAEGARFWMFCRLDTARWYVQGTFD